MRLSDRFHHPAAVHRDLPAPGGQPDHLRHLLPHPAAGRAERLRAGHPVRGPRPDPAAIRGSSRSSAWTRRSTCSTAGSSRPSSSARTTSPGRASTHCPPPCFGYSFRSQQPVWPRHDQRAPVTLSLAIGAAVLWLVGGVAIGVHLRAAPGHLLRPVRRWAIALAGVSLPIFFTGLLALALFSYKLAGARRTSQYVAVHHQPGASGRRTWCCPGSRSPSCTPRCTPG